jgi:transposase InsO family protein
MDFIRDNQVWFTATINDSSVGYLDGDTIVVDSIEHAQLSSTLPLDLTLWHKRLGHHHYNGIQRLIKDQLVVGLKLDSQAAPDPICEPCLAGKMHANPFPPSKHRAKEPLELVHCDLHDTGVRSRSGYRYWQVFVDDCTRFKASMRLKKKSEAFRAFQVFKAYAENKFGRKMKIFRHDKGGEFMSKEFLKFLEDCGITLQFTVRNRPQQNGVAERANRVIVEGIITMLEESGLSKVFWDEALAAFIHVANMVPTSSVPDKTPYEGWHNEKPNVSHLRVWGCLAYVHIQKDKRKHLGSHVEKCVFIGYPPECKGWKFYNPVTRKIVISERADFDERYNYFGTPLNKHVDYSKESIREELSKELTPEPTENRVTPFIEEVEDDSLELEQPDDNEPNDDIQEDDDVAPVVPVVPAVPIVPVVPVVAPVPVVPVVAPAAPTTTKRRSDRVKNPPGKWWEIKPSKPRPPDTDDEDEEEDEEDDEESEENAEYANLIMEIFDDEFAHSLKELEPHTYKEAVNSNENAQWKEAMTEEITALQENKTWTIVPRPKDKAVLGHKWVYKIKPTIEGAIERFKARLTVQGFRQRLGRDYFETFASTMRYASLRIVLALAAIEDLHLHSIDISQAFINGDIDAEVYMEQPEGFVQGGSDYVCKLNKALYGLKQAARLWSEKLTGVLGQLGFRKLYADPSLYIYDRDDIKVIVPVFVDDITLASSSEAAIDKFVNDLKAHFKLRDLGPTTFLLGMEIDRDWKSHQIFLSQHKYIKEKLEEFGMTDCKPVGTPMAPGLRLSKDECSKTAEDVEKMRNIPYMSAVGSLLYLANMTRPDISYVAGVLARFNSNPGMEHWKAVKHVFRYLKGTSHLRMAYGPDPSLGKEMFLTYSDADHGGNKDNGRSTSGYIVKLGKGVTCWGSKLQPVVTLSTTEAETVAGVVAGKEICWVQQLLRELGYSFSIPSPLLIDNQSAIAVAKNPEHHGRMKHLDLRFYWLRDQVAKKRITVSYLETENMPADLLTKALPKPQVERLRLMMGLIP